VLVRLGRWEALRCCATQARRRHPRSASRSTARRTRPTPSCAPPWPAVQGKKDPSVIKWKEIYENLETATDRCEDVANILEGVVLENA
jgi:hypothetical protein